MDPLSLLVAVLIVKGSEQYVGALASEAGSATWAGLSRILQAVSAQFTSDRPAERALDRVEGGPPAERATCDLAEHVHRHMAVDPAFRAKLEDLVDQGRRDPSAGEEIVRITESAERNEVLLD